MLDYFKTIVTAQLEAALSMLHDCILACPAEHWDSPIGKYPFWLTAYHTLCFTDLYLSPNLESFEYREIHPKGWSEFEDEYPSRRFEQAELIGYALVCRARIAPSIAAESMETLHGPSGFPWYTVTRGELHLVSLRHISHHAGQLAAFIRRLGPQYQTREALRWARSGWA